MNKLRFVDLFAGLGGFHLGLGRLGHDCVLASEIDPELREIYARNFGIEPQGDIRAIDPRGVPDFDLLCGGFPCQPFSKAGSQAGLDCARNGDLAGVVLDWIKTRRPRFVILENVANFERHDNGRTWRWLDRELRHAGYPLVQKMVLSPHRFGIPQIRERLFIVAARDSNVSFSWPEPSDEPTSIRSVLDPAEPGTSISPKIERAIEVWAEFVRLYPKSARKPHFPIWAAEFGATYPYLAAPPMAVPDAARVARGSLGTPLAGLGAAELEAALPPYARGTKPFPGWKKGFIDLNRQLYREHRSWIDPWLRRLEGFEHSYQKFEWNFDADSETVWETVIQMRGSGIRAKSPRTAPALIASSTSQVPIIGWERRYMTARECAQLQDMGDLKVLPRTFTGTTRALGNAVNARMVELVAQQLVGHAPHLSLVANG
jgi:DNA (cytosine-5)-methyltransferase 1